MVQEIIDSYLKVMNYILNFAIEYNLTTCDELDQYGVVEDSIDNILGNFELDILNLKCEEYDLNIAIDYLDKLISVLKFDDYAYENIIRCKSLTLFKLNKIEEADEFASHILMHTDELNKPVSNYQNSEGKV